MGNVIWTGVTDGNWNTGTNWDTGAAPVGGDDVFFTGGTVSVTTGPSSAINLASLTVTNGYSGSWSAAVVTLGTITALSMGGAGLTYRLSATVTTGVFDINPQTTISHEGGTWTTVTCSGSGTVNRSGTGVWTTSYVMPGVKVQNTSANQTFTTVTNGGTITSAGSIGTYKPMGNDRLTTTGAAAISTAITLAKGSYFNHVSSGTIVLLDALSGSAFPCSGSTRNFTITTANIYAGSMFTERPPGITVTITNKNYIGKSMQDFIPPPLP